MMGKFRDHSRPETKCDIGPLRLCPSDHSRFPILLPSGLEAKIFLTLHLFQGVNLIGNQFLFHKLKLPRPSPSGRLLSEGSASMCPPCLLLLGEGVDTGVSGHHTAVISPTPQMVPQLCIPFPRHLPQPLGLTSGSRSQKPHRS